MKKSLILSMTLALGVFSAAVAANPFADVPKGHWAYDSVAKLAAQGVVDGYPTGFFHGSKTMTRYEMAQIVAKALAKGALTSDDKLVSEFADELDALGVRVTNLEKNADKVKITGSARFGYLSLRGDKDGAITGLRTNLNFTGEINDNWEYAAQIRNDQNLKNNDGDSTTKFRTASVKGTFDTLEVKAGRFGYTMDDGGYIWDNRIDGITATYGDKTKATLGYGRLADADSKPPKPGDTTPPTGERESTGDKFWHGKIAHTLDKVTLEGNYVYAKSIEHLGNTNSQIYSLGAKFAEKNWHASGAYVHGSSDWTTLNNYGKNGYAINLTLSEAKKEEPHTWELWTTYYNQPSATILSPGCGGHFKAKHGFRGYGIGVDYILAKNITTTMQWHDLKPKEGEGKGDGTRALWTAITYAF